MSQARIVNGRWTRRVPSGWQNGDVFRTDIFKTVLSDQRLREAEFVLDDGRRVVIEVDDLRRVLVGGTEHYGGEIWGPFSVNIATQTVNGAAVPMRVS